MTFTTPNFKIDGVTLTFQPVTVEIEEAAATLVQTSNGGFLAFERPKGRVFHVTYGRGRMTLPGAMTELRNARNGTFIHTVTITEEDGDITATVIWPSDPPHPVEAPGHIAEFTFDLYESA